MDMRPRSGRTWAAFALCAVVAFGASSPASAAPSLARDVQTAADWQWPVDGARQVTARFEAPAHEYAPGHRGADIAAPVGGVVRSPADGVVAFRGVVVDRALITIDHGGGIVSTFEPVESTLSAGDAVSAGDPIGTVSVGGHSQPGTLHIGVRLQGVYVDPLVMFGEVERAVLLPCCAAL